MLSVTPTPPSVSRRHHTVWRHYLEAWKNKSGLLHWSLNGVIRPPTQSSNVMVSRDFYKLPRITTGDMPLLKFIVDSTGPEDLRQSHQRLVATLAYISKANALIQSHPRTSAADKRLVWSFVVEIQERLHAQIEQSAVSLLEELRQQQTAFIFDDNKAMVFYRFISHQYCRTKPMRDAVSAEISQMFPNHDVERLANVICHIGAENVGASLYVDRTVLDVVLLSSSSESTFLTGDQPVVNLMGTQDRRDTKELILYYPLSPDLACLVAPKESNLRSGSLSIDTVRQLNDVVARRSLQFLVAESDVEIEDALNGLALPPTPAHNILSAITDKSTIKMARGISVGSKCG